MFHLIVLIGHQIIYLSFIPSLPILAQMNNLNNENRPTKRRRRLRVTEDAIETADAIIIDRIYHQTTDGPVEQVNQIPVWNNRSGPEFPPLPATQGVAKVPEDIAQAEFPEIPDFNEDDRPAAGARVRQN
jgi:hypothetical protein